MGALVSKGRRDFNDRLMVFGGRSHPDLAAGICRNLGCQLGRVDTFEYGNDNTFVRVLENVRGADVFVVQTACRPVNHHTMELFILIDALRRASAARITAVVPFFPYMRSDKKDQPRVPITARLMADLIATAGADRVLTLDLHAEQIGGFFSIPSDHLTGLPLLTDHFARLGTDDLVVVGDTGRIKAASECARRLQVPLAMLDKSRDPISARVTIRGLIGDVRDRTVLYVEDEIATGESIRAGLNAIVEHSPRAIYGRLRAWSLFRRSSSHHRRVAHTQHGRYRQPSTRARQVVPQDQGGAGGRVAFRGDSPDSHRRLGERALR